MAETPPVVRIVGSFPPRIVQDFLRQKYDIPEYLDQYEYTADNQKLRAPKCVFDDSIITWGDPGAQTRTFTKVTEAMAKELIFAHRCFGAASAGYMSKLIIFFSKVDPHHIPTVQCLAAWLLKAQRHSFIKEHRSPVEPLIPLEYWDDTISPADKKEFKTSLDNAWAVKLSEERERNRNERE